MIQYLRIQNLALLEAVSLEFEGGFIAVTGETGAGKSILLGALSLLSGARMDKSIIRQAADHCEVEAAIFVQDSAALDAKLEELGLPPCEEGQLLCSRSLYRSKGPKVLINGKLATVANLQALGSYWIDFHGPGEPQKLFDESWQLALLDLFAGHGDALRDYRDGYRSWTELLQKIEALASSEKLDPDEAAFLQAQLEQIDSLELSVEAIDNLERDFNRLAQAQDLKEFGGRIQHGLIGDGGQGEQLGQLLPLARELGRKDADLQGLADRLESLIIECNDLGESYADVLDAIDLDPESAAQLEARMDAWLGLKRKYGGSIERVLQRRTEIADKLQSQGDVDGQIRKLRKQADSLEKQLMDKAEGLQESRLKAAHALAKQALPLLQHLGFKKAQLQIDLIREKRLMPHGLSRCSFLFTPNAGQSLMPLNKIASSGEIARVMLALKAVLAQVDGTPVLVFDEVDANVGGEIARKVGEELAQLGQTHQVFCITHLPQVAVTANSHFLVQKDQTDDSTAISISPLHPDREGRLNELARMLGDRSSAAARQHAESLLAGA
ncbi:MAG: DNA repair protein RecN [Opitutales bacterium]|nr:DNA repair protein RecN [Opitutales bacterium]